MKYRLLGIDIDGTLLGSDRRLSEETTRAISRAREAGLMVCLATGRSYAESIEIWRNLRMTPPFAPMILIGGALVSEPGSGRTLYQQSIPRELACEYADALAERNYPAMAIVDVWRYGWDYVLCETGDVHAVQRDWFDKMNVVVRRTPRLAVLPDLPNPLRINIVAERETAFALAAELGEQFKGRLNIHAMDVPNYEVTIVEAFSVKADKFQALQYVAQGYRIGRSQIAAIGDDVNDIPMLRGAGLGAAMAGDNPRVIEAADVVAEHGLADFIDRLVAGEFDEFSATKET